MEGILSPPVGDVRVSGSAVRPFTGNGYIAWLMAIGKGFISAITWEATVTYGRDGPNAGVLFFGYLGQRPRLGTLKTNPKRIHYKIARAVNGRSFDHD